MRIPLPRMMRYWREQHFASPSSPPVGRYATRLWAFAAMRPWLYQPASRLIVGLLGAMGRRSGRFRRLPLAGGWTLSRDLPAPQGKTFQAQWRNTGRAERGARP